MIRKQRLLIVFTLFEIIFIWQKLRKPLSCKKNVQQSHWRRSSEQSGSPMAARWERKGRPPVHQGPQGKAAYPRFNGKSMNEGTLTVLNTAMDHRPSEFRRHTCPGVTPALLPISAPRNMPKSAPKSASRSPPEAILAQRFMASTITHFSVLIQNDKKHKNVKQKDQNQ